MLAIGVSHKLPGRLIISLRSCHCFGEVSSLPRVSVKGFDERMKQSYSAQRNRNTAPRECPSDLHPPPGFALFDLVRTKLSLQYNYLVKWAHKSPRAGMPTHTWTCGRTLEKHILTGDAGFSSLCEWESYFTPQLMFLIHRGAFIWSWITASHQLLETFIAWMWEISVI